MTMTNFHFTSTSKLGLKLKNKDQDNNYCINMMLQSTSKANWIVADKTQQCEPSSDAIMMKMNIFFSHKNKIVVNDHLFALALFVKTNDNTSHRARSTAPVVVGSLISS